MSSNEQPDGPYNVETVPGFTERHLGLSFKYFFMAIIAVVLLAVYISNLLFGDSSLEVLMELEEYELYLSDEVSRLKAENAELQKEYFELKELSPQTQN
jgi:cell division protein FtsB